MTMNGEGRRTSGLQCIRDDLQRVYYYSVFPNMLLLPIPIFVLFHHITPLGPDKLSMIAIGYFVLK